MLESQLLTSHGRERLNAVARDFSVGLSPEDVDFARHSACEIMIGPNHVNVQAWADAVGHMPDRLRRLTLAMAKVVFQDLLTRVNPGLCAVYSALARLEQEGKDSFEEETRPA